MVVFFVMGVFGLAIFALRRSVTTPEAVIEKDTAQIASLDQQTTTMPSIPFSDVTQEWGIELCPAKWCGRSEAAARNDGRWSRHL